LKFLGLLHWFFVTYFITFSVGSVAGVGLVVSQSQSVAAADDSSGLSLQDEQLHALQQEKRTLHTYLKSYER
jgi:hypothetical protein